MNYVGETIRGPINPVRSNENASFSKTFKIDALKPESQIALPQLVDEDGLSLSPWFLGGLRLSGFGCPSAGIITVGVDEGDRAKDGDWRGDPARRADDQES